MSLSEMPKDCKSIFYFFLFFDLYIEVKLLLRFDIID